MVTDGNGSTSDVRCGDVLPYVCYKKFAQLTMTQCGTTDPGNRLVGDVGNLIYSSTGTDTIGYIIVRYSLGKGLPTMPSQSIRNLIRRNFVKRTYFEI